MFFNTGGPPRPGMLPTPPMGGPPMMPMMGPPPHGMMPGGPGKKCRLKGLPVYNLFLMNGKLGAFI